MEKDFEGKFYIYPIRISSSFRNENHFDLLYLQEDSSSNEVNGHYCYITDLGRLVASQITVDGHRIFICRRCLTHFGNQNLLDNHEILCNSQDPIKIRMPVEDKLIRKFKNYHFQQRIPYVVYAGLECALTPFSLSATRISPRPLWRGRIGTYPLRAITIL